MTRSDVVALILAAKWAAGILRSKMFDPKDAARCADALIEHAEDLQKQMDELPSQ